MINRDGTVLCRGKVLGGITTVPTPTSTVSTSRQVRDHPRELTGTIGKMTTDP